MRIDVPNHALRNTHRAHMRKRARSDDQTRFIQHASGFSKQKARSTQHAARSTQHAARSTRNRALAGAEDDDGRARTHARTHAHKPPTTRLTDGTSAYICAARITRSRGTHHAHRHTNGMRIDVPNHALRNTHRVQMRKRARSDDQTRFIQHASGFIKQKAQSTQHAARSTHHTGPRTRGS